MILDNTIKLNCGIFLEACTLIIKSIGIKVLIVKQKILNS
jgi:hypothetical protein